MSRASRAVFPGSPSERRSQRLVLPDAVPPVTPMQRGRGYPLLLSLVTLSSDLTHLIERPSLPTSKDAGMGDFNKSFVAEAACVSVYDVYSGSTICPRRVSDVLIYRFL